MQLDRRPWPIFHFGMTGGFHSPAVKSVKLKSSGNKDRGPQWPPRFWKLQMKFSGGGELVMTDARRLGRIRLRHDPRNEPPISLLGFDALHDLPASRTFHELLHPRKAPIKAVLLDQGFSAGVGNWIADEVLYQARIDPRRRAQTLTARETARIRYRIGSVLRTAIRVGSDGDRFPKSWLFHYRWDRGVPTARGGMVAHPPGGGGAAGVGPGVRRGGGGREGGGIWMRRTSERAIPFRTTPERLYRLYLSARQHAAACGGWGEATIQARVGGRMAMAPHIKGKFLSLVPGKLIVQT